MTIILRDMESISNRQFQLNCKICNQFGSRGKFTTKNNFTLTCIVIQCRKGKTIMFFNKVTSNLFDSSFCVISRQQNFLLLNLMF